MADIAADTRRLFQNRRIELFPAIATLILPRGKDLPREKQLKLPPMVMAKSHRPPAVSTEVYLYWDDSHLHATFECREPHMEQVRAVYPEHAIYTDDVVELKLDVDHGHHKALHFSVNAAGKQHALSILRTRASMGWERGWTVRDEKFEGPWQGEVQKHADGWTARMHIPLSTLSQAPVGPETIMGLSVLRCRTPWPPEVSTFPPMYQDANDPSHFAVLHFSPPPVALKRLSFGEITLGFNQAEMTIQNCLDRQAEFVVRLRTSFGLDDQPYRTVEQTRTLGPGQAESLAMEFELNGIDWKSHRIVLEITEKESGQGYRGSFSYGYTNGYLLGFRPHGAKPTPNPTKGEPDYLNKKRAYILSHLPRFVRRTTAEGAPSDFYLQAADRSVAFNLMKAGVLSEMADYLHRRFENDEDRLLAANYLFHQPDVLTYTKQVSSVTARLNPLSILRLGGGMCSEFAAALLGLLRKMKDSNGRPYQAWQLNTSCPAEGHCVVTVVLDGRRVLLDPSVGRFYISRAGEVASIDELAGDPELFEAGCVNQARIFSCPPRQWYSDAGNINWPDGAPEE